MQGAVLSPRKLAAYHCQAYLHQKPDVLDFSAVTAYRPDCAPQELQALSLEPGKKKIIKKKQTATS